MRNSWALKMLSSPNNGGYFGFFSLNKEKRKRQFQKPESDPGHLGHERVYIFSDPELNPY